MKTTTGTFPLFISADPYDEPIRFEVEVTAEITEPIPERGPSYACAGEPAVEGRADIISVTYWQLSAGKLIPKSARWLFDIIPQATLDRWATKLYEDYSPADDRADWERGQHKDADMARKNMLAMGIGISGRVEK